MAKRRIDASVVVQSLGDWTARQGPRFQRLAAALVASIRRGDLPSGGNLPSERRLAALLSVSRGTVVATYDLLRDEGWVQRKPGSGTWVSVAIRGRTVDTAAVPAAVRARRLTVRGFHPTADIIDLGISILPDASSIPVSALRCGVAELGAISDGHGYQPLGVRALRTRLAELHTAQGLPTAPSEIIVTAGGMQGIALATRLLVRHGDCVLIENPTYPGAIDALARAGARLVTIPTDGAGARVDAIDREAGRTHARLVYVIPSCHNPTGSIMPEGRRRALVRFAAEHDLWVLDDASLSHLTFGNASPLPLAAYGPDDRVLTIGSLNKLLWGGLRVGWIRGPRSAIAALHTLKAAEDLGTSVLAQTIALRALENYCELVVELTMKYAARAHLLMELLASDLPDWRYDRPAGGLSLWIQLPHGAGDEFALAASAHGVAVLPGTSSSPDASFADHIRVSFALPETVLREGVRRLAAAWRTYSARAGARRLAGGALK